MQSLTPLLSTRRRANSLDLAQDALFEHGRGRSHKAVHHGWTKDDTCTPLAPSWKRSAFVSRPASPPVMKMPELPAHAARFAFLDEASNSIGKYPWVKNDDTPWGVLGARPDVARGCSDSNYIQHFGDTAVFHNRFRAWVDACEAADFEALPDNATMNCRDFVTLCFAKICGATPRERRNMLNTQAWDNPHPVSSAHTYRALGAALRVPLDEHIFPGDIVFYESKKDGLRHVAILEETEPKLWVIDCGHSHGVSRPVSIRPFVFEDGIWITYVPFDHALRTFVAHITHSASLEKKFSYDAFLSILLPKSMDFSRA